MRSSKGLIGILLTVVVLAAAPGVARADGNGAAVFRVTFHGEVAIAGWTTCPQWQAGLVCDDTVIIASDAATSERWPDGRLRDREPRVVLQRFHYEVVDLGGELAMRPLLESFGGTSDATVAIDTQARRAVVQAAAIPMTTTDYVNDTQTTGSAALDASWSATGPRSMMKDRLVESGPGWHLVASTKGWERPATASGTIDGAPIPGTLGSAVIIHVLQSELSVYPPTHG